MPIDAKICGLTTAEAVDAAAEHGATHAGFVFFADSPRNIAPRDARTLARNVPGHMKRVGVFVEPDDSLLERAIAAAKLDIVQFHGKETPKDLKSVRARHDVEIWKAISVSKASDLEEAKRYEEDADLILFDARAPKSARRPGGMGIAFDWKLLNRYKHRSPWGLSGGLNIDNVATAIATTGAQLVDVSSGVESSPGIKDPDLIEAFLRAANAAEAVAQ